MAIAKMQGAQHHAHRCITQSLVGEFFNFLSFFDRSSVLKCLETWYEFS